ncbi:MAG: hypothetical protein ACREF4_04710 [Gammaproteobacteria bacterium]
MLRGANDLKGRSPGAESRHRAVQRVAQRLLAAPVRGDGGADLAAFGEVALELGAHLFEAWSDLSLDASCRRHAPDRLINSPAAVSCNVNQSSSSRPQDAARVYQADRPEDRG